MTDRVINYELLDFTMKYIQNNPENHNQGLWFKGELETESGTQVADQNVCGSQGCFAGWASIFAGWHQVRPHNACEDCNVSEADAVGPICEDGLNHLFDMRYDLVVNEEGTIKSMRKAAQEALGLDDWQASQLFKGDNNQGKLESMVTTLHNTRGAHI